MVLGGGGCREEGRVYVRRMSDAQIPGRIIIMMVPGRRWRGRQNTRCKGWCTIRDIESMG